MMLEGTSVSTGAAHGVTVVVDARPLLESARDVPPGGSAAVELERFNAAAHRACAELERLKRQLRHRVGEDDVAIFDTHAALVRDPKFREHVTSQIQVQGQSAESAVAEAINDVYMKLSDSDLSMVCEKAADILDVGRRVLRCLASNLEPGSELPQRAVLVTSSLTPSELIHYVHQGAVAFLTEHCGMKSHVAILARALGVPLVTNVPAATEVVPNNCEIYVDARSGRIAVAPTPKEHKHVERVLAAERASPKPIGCDRPLTTEDGAPVTLLFNLSDLGELDLLSTDRSPGIGLFRTEFLYMDRSWWPSEDECYEIYRRVSEAIGSGELNIRVPDFGDEKCPPYSEIPINRNPALGLRGLRFLLENEDILGPQIKALCRLGCERPLTVMLPMLDSTETLQRTTSMFCAAAGCERTSELPFSLGAMIECPSAALTIDHIIESTDSVSIGLNDLTQYVMAADRDDRFMEKYHDPANPAILRLVDQIVRTANDHGKPVTLCGDLLDDYTVIALLLGLGVRRFSIYRASYAEYAKFIRELSMASIERLVENVWNMRSSTEIRIAAQETLSLAKLVGTFPDHAPQRM
jgi:phosphotransferase system enzyme I (PtsI)